MCKFDVVTHMGRLLVLGGQPWPDPKGTAPVLPNFWGFPISVSTHFEENDQIGRGNTYGQGLVLGSHSRPPSEGSMALVGPNFAGCHQLMRTRLDLEQPISVW